MIHCVTTMNKDYYNGIGKLMIHTWLECFSADYRLHLYLEDFTLDINDPRIVVEDWTPVRDLWNIWNNTRGTRSQRHQKFAKKACTQISAWDSINQGQVLWLDADMIFIQSVPDNFFNTVLEDYALASWGNHSFESGTVFVNLSHPEWHKIFDGYKDIYVGDRGLPDGEKWFDGELLGRAVRDSGVAHRDLWCYCDKKTSTPLNWSWLGNYMRHFKASAHKGDRLETELIGVGRPDLVELLNSR